VVEMVEIKTKNTISPPHADSNSYITG